MLLDGRVAVITGGASGIGLATAQRFGAEGAKLFLATKNQEKIDRALPLLREKGCHAEGMRVDVRQMSEVQAMAASALEHFGRIDVLVCSHGYSHFDEVVSHAEQEWVQVIDVDLTGCFRCSKAVLPAMIEQKWGRILYLAATSSFRCEPAWTAKCSAKTGLLGLTRGLALEVAKHGITVNCVCPAWVKTERADFAVREQARRQGKDYEQLWNEIVDAYPMKRVTEPEEQADLMLYLASEAARGMTGQAISLTAGAEW